MSKRIWTVLLGVICVAGLCAAAFLYIKKDRQGPKINIPHETVTYNENDELESLLEGVTAKDDVDGDVSDSLIVEAIYPSADGKKAKVVYAAMDSSNNVAKDQRLVDYVSGDDAAQTEEAAPETEMESELMTEAGMTAEEAKMAFIAMVNGTNIEGLATNWKTKLEGDGYQHVYSGSASENTDVTIIYTKDAGLARELQNYFKDAVVESEMPQDGIDVSLIGADACVVVGSNDAEGF